MSTTMKKKNVIIEFGKYKDKNVLVKNGPFGYYINYNNKNKSLKYILRKKDIKDIQLKDIQPLLDKI